MVGVNSASSAISPIIAPEPLSGSQPVATFDGPTHVIAPPLNKRCRLNSGGSVNDDFFDRFEELFNANLQWEFSGDLVKVWSSCGFSWNSANNPEVTLFFKKWVCSAIIPDRRTLSGWVLNEQAELVYVKTRDIVRGRKATYQADGWRNCAKTNIITSMIICLCMINLIVGDYLKLNLGFMDCITDAFEVIKWFNNHLKALDLLWEVQWALVLAAGEREEQRSKGEEIVKVIMDDHFWYNLKRIHGRLLPLAVAANILQGPSCHFDHVLLTLGNLYCLFNELSLGDKDDVSICKAMHQSLHLWWGRAEQELMILAVFLNPYIRYQCFNPNALPPVNLFHMVYRAYEWLMRKPVASTTEFLKAQRNYFESRGSFSVNAMALGEFKGANENGGTLDLIDLWSLVHGSSTAENELVKLAIHILSIVPNSASTDPEMIHKQTVVRMDRHAKHKQLGMVHDCKQRNFGPQAVDEDDSEDSVPATLPSMAQMLIEHLHENEQDNGPDSNSNTEHMPMSEQPGSSSQSPVESLTGSLVERPSRYQKIPLVDLFKYPPKGMPINELAFYWKGAIDSLCSQEEELGRDISDNSASS
ncbi:hypothetical protein PQX77_001429 [Marasmius sp. AFHP31]|nr:hypothetical protein PQX77_001429 [Marasmius sp. AFHP31]